MTELPRSCRSAPQIEEDGYDWYRRHAVKCALCRSNRYDLVFVGDSITHYWSGEDRDYGAAVWHEFYDRRRVLNLGCGFDRTQNVLWRLEHGELAGQNPKVIVLNIGTNQFSVTPRYSGDTGEETAAGIVAVTEALLRRCPGAEVIVMALFPRGGAGKKYQPKIDCANAAVRAALDGRERVVFMDIGARLAPECYRPCLTHLNETGYRVWAEALEPELRRRLNQ